MEIDFTGKVALVTGAGKGIGREVAKLLAKCGANVIALTRTQSDLDSLKKEIPNLQTICVDLINLKEAIDAIEAAGHIDLVVNNAALVIHKSSLDVTEDDMEKSMKINVTAPLMISQVVARKNIDKGSGSVIVNISTMGSRYGMPQSSPYASCKAALETLTKALAVELAPYKIRVNCLCPGVTKTPLVTSLCEAMPKALEPFLQRTPMARFAEPEEMAHSVAYLLSDKASFITGTCLISDGGYSAC